MDAPNGSLEPWDRYARAVVEIEVDGGVLELTPRDAGALPSTAATAPVGGALAGTVTILTACDPYPEVLPAAENRRRTVALDARLDALRLPHLPALGRSPDHRESEVSRALLDVDRGAALAVAAEFGQLAVFEIDGATIACVAVADAAVMTRRGYDVRLRP